MSYFDNCEKSEGDRGDERSEKRGVFLGTMRNTPRFSEMSFRVADVGFGIRCVERCLKMSVQSHGMR